MIIKKIEYLPIQRGGGTGPMKPGNQRSMVPIPAHTVQ